MPRRKMLNVISAGYFIIEVQCLCFAQAWCAGRHRLMEAVLRVQGDSGFMLVRDGEVVFKSPVLQHFFDCPLQFGACPDYSESTDTAEDAAVFELAVQPGDVLLAGSDGLWDNCYDSELMQLLPDRPEAVDQVCLKSAAFVKC